MGRGYPDASGNFSVSVTIPASASPGQLKITAIIGNGGSADTYFNVTPGSIPTPSPSPTPTSTLIPIPSTQLPPEIVRAETFREGDLVFLRLIFTDPNNDAEGFGFRAAKGSGWAEETHPFSSPSYGRVLQGQIEYPFNHGCEIGPAIESDVEAWIYDSSGLVSPSVTVHLACQSTVTPTSTPTPTPTVSPSPTVSATPTSTPTLTPTVTVTPIITVEPKKPIFYCLGGKPGEQCGQPSVLIRQPLQQTISPEMFDNILGCGLEFILIGGDKLEKVLKTTDEIVGKVPNFI